MRPVAIDAIRIPVGRQEVADSLQRHGGVRIAVALCFKQAGRLARVGRPDIQRMLDGKPGVPIRELESHRQFAGVEYLPGARIHGRIDVGLCHRIGAVEGLADKRVDEGLRVGQHRIDPGTRGPFDDRLAVHARAGLIGWIPGRRLRDVWHRVVERGSQVGNDLLALCLRQPVEARALNDGVVGVVEVLQIPSVGGVAGTARRSKLHGHDGRLQQDVLRRPQRLALIGIWRPGLARCLLGSDVCPLVRVLDQVLPGGVLQLQVEDAVAVRVPIRAVEAEFDSIACGKSHQAAAGGGIELHSKTNRDQRTVDAAVDPLDVVKLHVRIGDVDPGRSGIS